MNKNKSNKKIGVVFPNIGIKGHNINRARGMKKLMYRSLLVSIMLSALIYFTFYMVNMNVGGFIVYSSIVALVIFLGILLLRYFGILFTSFLFVTKYSFSETHDFNPFVSIIVPIYNESLVIKESIKSLLRMDYNNFEIIIVNDGSTDDTAEQCEELVGVHKGLNSDINVTLLNKPNGGKSSALNTGIQYSKADFVLCMDG
ncbi:MAG: glycosyltransferase family 2 protein, partial [Melioribacteraceae bacterium]|nr:glycosyltransferase family 2 protein [Melioribacteraceae bacterium]